MIHVMTEDTVALLADVVPLPSERIYVLPHPSYVGVVPDVIDRATARAGLGIPRGAHVIASIGQVRPYKGHRLLLEALDEVLETDPDVFWLVGGKLLPSPETDAFVADVAAHPRVLLHPGAVPDGSLQYFLRAADVAAFPYRAGLNSGSLMLATSFGLPVVASHTFATVDLVPAQARVVVDALTVEAWADGLRRSRQLATAQARDAADAFARSLRPEVVAARFAADMRTWLDTGVVPMSR
jgi:beta-1,4-mannosyltransferase